MTPAWDGNGRALEGRCKPSCCGTPYGHSTARDSAVRASDRCQCHGEPVKPSHGFLSSPVTDADLDRAADAELIAYLKGTR